MIRKRDNWFKWELQRSQPYPYLSTEYSLLDGIHLMQMKAQCDPELKQHRERTHFWVDGQKNYGQIPGWKA
jgi:hypothetical protein